MPLPLARLSSRPTSSLRIMARFPNLKPLALCLALTGLSSAAPTFLDLPTTMRLAGARNDDIALARSKHAEAIADSRTAWQRFWPSLSLAAASRGHQGRVQDIGGAVFDASKQQYTLGGALLVDWSPGEIYYSALAANQHALAAGELAEATRKDILLKAIDHYYTLLAAEASLAVASDDLQLSDNYAAQLNAATTTGTAYRADFLRASLASTRLRLALGKASESRDLAAANLAETLRLPPLSELRPAKSDLVPVTLSSPSSIQSLLNLAAASRPELRAAAANLSAASIDADRARLAPLIPSVNAGYSLGALGGGRDGQWASPRDSHDLFLGLTWKIGPGGIFDTQRKKTTALQQQRATLTERSLQASIANEVVSAATKAASAADQIRLCDKAVADATEILTLASQRKASEIGAVADVLLAREDVSRARQARIQSVTDFNKAQHELRRATGQ